MTFSEFFEQLELQDLGFGEFAYILDAPQAMFDALKSDMALAIEQEIDSGNFLRSINADDSLDIYELKQEMVEAYNVVAETLESEEFDLPKDRVEFFLDLLGMIRDKTLELPERKTIEITYEKMDDEVLLPNYAHDTDAGADIHANEEVEIAGNTTVIVKTGLKVAVPVGWELQIRPRSGMSAKTPIRIANAPGTIDSGYRDEIGIICHNTSPYPYTIHKGDRIAQIVPKLCPMISWKEGKVKEIGDDRKGGFGSTGN